MLKPAAIYFALTFAVGCVFGSIRVLILTPRIGDVASVLIECPFILGASFLFARWVLKRLASEAGTLRRLLIGLIAFAMLLIAEVLMSLLSGITPREFVTSLFKTAGAIGLACQVVFSLIPLFIVPRDAAQVRLQ